MKIKEYTTELDVDKKNVLREIGHYVIVKEKYNSPQKFADFAREKLHLDMRAEEYVYILGLTSKNTTKRCGSVCYDPQSSVRR